MNEMFHAAITMLHASTLSLSLFHSFSPPHPPLEDEGIIVAAHHIVTEYHPGLLCTFSPLYLCFSLLFTFP